MFAPETQTRLSPQTKVPAYYTVDNYTCAFAYEMHAMARDGDVLVRLYFQTSDRAFQDAIRGHPLCTYSESSQSKFDSQNQKSWSYSSQQSDSSCVGISDSIDSTLTTASTSSTATTDALDHLYRDWLCLEIPFSYLASGDQGFTIGRHQTCDLAFLHQQKIADFHGALTFDNEYRLVFTDIKSSHGTVVTYKSDDRAFTERTKDKRVSSHDLRRRGFTWIVGGADVEKEISIRIGDKITFSLVVPSRDWASDSHKRNVGQFIKGAPTSEFAAAFTKFLATPPSNEKGFSDQPITIHRRLGFGSFAVVYRKWDVTSGRAVAIKLPLGMSVNEKLQKMWDSEILVWEKIWSKEDADAELPGGIPPNIVRLKETRMSGGDKLPKIVLECAPMGNLKEHKDITEIENMSITFQCLEALAFLHDKKGIVHRDIKPANILVFSRGPQGIHVKLTDFGVSKRTSEQSKCRTYCGTKLYYAPEVVEAGQATTHGYVRAYDGRCDIWSLGVVTLELELLRHGHKLADLWENAKGWCERLAMMAGEEDDLFSSPWTRLVSRFMLKCDAKERLSADACLKEVIKCIAQSHGFEAPATPSSDGSSPTPSPSSFKRALVDENDIRDAPSPAKKRRPQPPTGKIRLPPAVDSDGDVEMRQASSNHSSSLSTYRASY